MTKITAVGPGGNCPLFLGFLNRIMNGNADVISYLQRVFGYGLTGEIIEHEVFLVRDRRERQECAAFDGVGTAWRLSHGGAN